jgi:N-methylhydantoinase A
VHIYRIAIPYSPGTLCATGSVLANFRLDYVKTVYAPLEKLDQAEGRRVDRRSREARARHLKEAEQEIESIHTVRSAGVRYAGRAMKSR